MSDHTTSLVPINCWWYLSPELVKEDKDIQVDIGLLAEALIYYDRVCLAIDHYGVFNELLSWFIKRNKLSDLLALIKDGTISFCYYSFVEGIGVWSGVHDVLTTDDKPCPGCPSFEENLLGDDRLNRVMHKHRDRQKLRRAIEGRIVQVNSDECRPAFENARMDYKDPKRCALLVQSALDEMYKFLRLGPAPEVDAEIIVAGSKTGIIWNIGFEHPLIKESGFHPQTPLLGAVVSNRILWSAAKFSCDLYLGSPMSTVVGDKLYESTERIAKASAVIEDLQAKVGFPDLRVLVNGGKLDLREILRIRKKARKFRDWLQQESERDRDAIIAYHNETARELGVVTASRKIVSMFGVIGGGAAGSLVGTAVAGPVGAAVGGAAGSATGYLADLVSKIGADWKPVVFGNWFRDRIERLVEEQSER